jgi:hypothetical protein
MQTRPHVFGPQDVGVLLEGTARGGTQEQSHTRNGSDAVCKKPGGSHLGRALRAKATLIQAMPRHGLPVANIRPMFGRAAILMGRQCLLVIASAVCPSVLIEPPTPLHGRNRCQEMGADKTLAAREQPAALRAWIKSRYHSAASASLTVMSLSARTKD